MGLFELDGDDLEYIRSFLSRVPEEDLEVRRSICKRDIEMWN